MAEVGIFVGTVYGNALLVAEEAQSILTQQGHKATVFEDPALEAWQYYRHHYSLIVTSTTGQGDMPDSIAPLFHAVTALGYEPDLKYGVIALGDRNYENFCAAGKAFDGLLQEQSATRIGAMLCVDAAQTAEPESVTNPWVSEWGKLLS